MIRIDLSGGMAVVAMTTAFSAAGYIAYTCLATLGASDNQLLGCGVALFFVGYWFGANVNIRWHKNDAERDRRE
jgi:hypothetical protein